MRHKCPNCGSFAKVRSSNELAGMVREQYVECQNVLCRFYYVVQLTPVRTIQPSLKPNPAVDLPRAKRRVRSKRGG